MVELLVRFVTLVVFISYICIHLPSLISEIPITTKRGPQAVRGPKGLMIDIDWSIPINRK